jgi:hypothetical protein
MKMFGWVLIGFVLMSTVCFAEVKQPAPSNYAKDILSNKDYANFLKVTLGDDFQQVNELFGGKLEENTSVKPKRAGAKKYNTADPFLKIYFEFADGKLYSKTAGSFSLKMKAEVTKDHFALLKEGMTYEEVKAILGEGVLIDEWLWPDNSKLIQQYEWRLKEKPEAYMNIVLTNGKATAIQENGVVK